MAKQSRSPEQQDRRQRKREQQQCDEERASFGSQGAASECRKVDVASGCTISSARASFTKDEQAGRRPDWPKRLALIPVTDKAGPEPHKEGRERGFNHAQAFHSRRLRLRAGIDRGRLGCYHCADFRRRNGSRGTLSFTLRLTVMHRQLAM
jgi:hypothetical protein